MQQTLRAGIYKETKYYNGKLTFDVKDNDFKPLVDKIMDSNQSYLPQAQVVVANNIIETNATKLKILHCVLPIWQCCWLVV
jgi:hypothetical protein